MKTGRTSLHGLNADRPLDRAGNAAYFLLNWFDNRLPHRFVDPRPEIRDFSPGSVEERWTEVPIGASPSRRLSDFFCMTLPWDAIRDELGSVHLVDVGCGSDGYGPRLLAWAGGRIATYTGMDLRPGDRWAELAASDGRLRFLQAGAEQAGAALPVGSNFIMSQSAVEHLDHDLRFFEQMRDYARAYARPVVQVHAVPS